MIPLIYDAYAKHAILMNADEVLDTLFGSAINDGIECFCKVDATACDAESIYDIGEHHDNLFISDSNKISKNDLELLKAKYKGCPCVQVIADTSKSIDKHMLGLTLKCLIFKKNERRMAK